MARDVSTGNYLRILNPTGALDLSGTACTVAAWVKADTAGVSSNGLTIAGKAVATDATTQYVLGLLNSGSGAKPYFKTGNGAGSTDIIVGATTVTTAAWHHVAGYASTRTRVFLDGVQDGDKAQSFPIGDTAANFAIGVRSDGTTGPFDGLIAEVAVWNTQLSDAEIAALAKGVCPLLVRPKNLAAYYPLWGVGAAGEPDLSANAQHLTEVGTVGVGDHAPVGPYVAL